MIVLAKVGHLQLLDARDHRRLRGGCDGAHSRVRHELDLPFHGHPYPQDWLLADVRLDWARSEERSPCLLPGRRRPLICSRCASTGGGWWCRSRVTGPPEPQILERGPAAGPPAGTGTDRRLRPTWLASFNCHRRSTGTYRRGHCCCPAMRCTSTPRQGGQGMNTGITDAHNLGWKLALVAAGRAPGQPGHLRPRARAGRGPGARPDAHAGPVRHHDPSGAAGPPGRYRPGGLRGRPGPPAGGPPLDPGQRRLPRQQPDLA